MPVLVTSKFDDDSIENERASMGKAFSHYKPTDFFFFSDAQVQLANSVVSSPIWPKFELVQNVMHVILTCKYNVDRI